MATAATVKITKNRVIKNCIEITQSHDREADQNIEHVDYSLLSDHLEIALYKDAEDDEEVLVNNLILPFKQVSLLKSILNNPQETAILKDFLERNDVSEYLN